ncbi:hypothetical protein NPIL_685511 [Nephila pilipes]|uniref:Ribonuclease P/MRP protein subunit POP5 n=1 Tax=Nephila pilipes TaxID=299642 RepID=A0A8X6TYC0_NEPPI|nr:hypothetical protein NPIL_685511 [Nephila pilipes]
MVRVKYRYILCELVTETHKNILELPLKLFVLKQAINDSVNELHGDFGIACIQARFIIKVFNPITRIVVLRVDRRFHSVLSTSLPLVTSAGKLKFTIRTLHLSGTIRCALDFLVNYDKQKLCQLVQKHDISAEDQQELSAIIANCEQKLYKIPNKK